jgi:sulfur carrier protein
MQRQIADQTSLTVNGEATSTGARTLAGLLAELGHAETAVATAVNGTFVGRAARGGTRLSAGDRIEIVAPRQGG